MKFQPLVSFFARVSAEPFSAVVKGQACCQALHAIGRNALLDLKQKVEAGIQGLREGRCPMNLVRGAVAFTLECGLQRIGT